MAKRLNVNISDHTAEMLGDIAARLGVSTMTEALARSIATEALLAEAVARGDKVLIASPDESVREVVFL